MENPPTEGTLFRINYLRSPNKLADSIRARKRIGSLFTMFHKDRGPIFARMVQSELGIDYPTTRNRYGVIYDHADFWEHADLGDILSGITLWLQASSDIPYLLSEIRRIFAEECLQYRLDDKGGVHFLIDEQFAGVAESTLEGLSIPKFKAARDALETGLKNLSPNTQSGKGLIRGVFEAAETTFLVIAGPNAGNRLNEQAVKRHLKPLLIDRYNGVPNAADKVDRILATFVTWISDAHPYRHGTPDGHEVHEAPIDLAILSATTGMGFIRFLAGI